MPPKKDYAGKKMNKLTALRPDPERKGYWIFRCDCGTEKSIRPSNVFSGETKSCGCGKIKDLTGKHYGHLMAIENTGRTNRDGYIWICRCDCGKIVEVSAGKLTQGVVKSCGCQQHKRKDITGKRYCRLVAIKPVGKKNETTIWQCQCDCGNVVNVVVNSLETGKTRSCGCLQKEHVKSMFAGGTNVVKLFSEKKIRSTNTSGVTGVSWSKRKGRWEATITFQGKKHHLGFYNNLEDAAAARKKAEERLYGDFEIWYKENYGKEKEQ